MVSKWESVIEKLDMQRENKCTSKIFEIQDTIAEMEAEQPAVEDAEAGIAILVNKGINTIHVNNGELMLEASLLGEINVVKSLECPQYTIAYVNSFGEGLLHYAAKGNQEKMVAYLLKRGIDPNV